MYVVCPLLVDAELGSVMVRMCGIRLNWPPPIPRTAFTGPQDNAFKRGWNPSRAALRLVEFISTSKITSPNAVSRT